MIILIIVSQTFKNDQVKFSAHVSKMRLLNLKKITDTWFKTLKSFYHLIVLEKADKAFKWNGTLCVQPQPKVKQIKEFITLQ